MEMTDRSLICLATVHGIGFEQAPEPENGIAGYADRLHQGLSAALGAGVLGDDPGRTRVRPGENGPVYVQSLWPPQAPTREQGLARLGRWASREQREIDASAAQLVDAGQRVAHIALVYSHLEAQGPHAGSALVAGSMAMAQAGHYASVVGLARMLISDAVAMRGAPAETSGQGGSSLRVRASGLPEHRRVHLPFRQPAPAAPADPSGLLVTLRNLENDVAAYVSRNDLRERVRAFVREALIRLAARPDVERIVVNAHSNGTVVAFDVLSDLPIVFAQKVVCLVTAGSPLRKYAELFNWGTDAGSLRTLQGWTNFWDQRDPVADPLVPPAGWRVGDALPPGPQAGLFQSVDPDTGAQIVLPIEDREVDNVANSRGGGLRAHNYWDNDAEVVQPLAAVLNRLMAVPAMTG
jgi:hypothetical protein